jgi:hypothetical protein
MRPRCCRSARIRHDAAAMAPAPATRAPICATETTDPLLAGHAPGDRKARARSARNRSRRRAMPAGDRARLRIAASRARPGASSIGHRMQTAPAPTGQLQTRLTTLHQVAACARCDLASDVDGVEFRWRHRPPLDRRRGLNQARGREFVKALGSDPQMKVWRDGSLELGLQLGEHRDRSPAEPLLFRRQHFELDQRQVAAHHLMTRPGLPGGCEMFRLI